MTKAMTPLSITGYGEVEVKSVVVARKLEKFLAQNPCLGKPTHKIKIKIEGYINEGNVSSHDGTGQPFGLEITKAVIGDFK